MTNRNRTSIPRHLHQSIMNAIAKHRQHRQKKEPDLLTTNHIFSQQEGHYLLPKVAAARRK